MSETIKNAANYVSETVQGTMDSASKEGNKSIAKDPNQGVAARANAGVQAVGDKLSEEAHGTKAEVHKEAAKQ